MTDIDHLTPEVGMLVEDALCATLSSTAILKISVLISRESIQLLSTVLVVASEIRNSRRVSKLYNYIPLKS